MVDSLGKFVEFKGKPKELSQLLKDKEVFKGNTEGEEAIAEMDLLFEYLESMNSLDNIVFDFSLARGLDYYTGIIFEAVLTDTDRVGSIAGGGRYDGLVGMFSSKSIPAIGGSIGIERIFAILEDNFPDMRSTETQILIASLGKGMVSERFKLCNDLWSVGLKAETLYNDNPKPQKQLDYCFDNGIPLVAFIGENELKEGNVSVKVLNTKEQLVIPRSEFVQRVKELIEAHPVLLPQAKP